MTFDSHFKQYFDFNDRIAQKESRKMFKCTMTGLRRDYPDIFGYKSQAVPIYILPGKEEIATEIFHQKYIPEIVSKSPNVQVYPSGQIYIKYSLKDSKRKAFKELRDFLEKNNSKFNTLKELKDYLKKNNSNFTPQQLDGFAYRYFKELELKNENSISSSPLQPDIQS